MGEPDGLSIVIPTHNRAEALAGVVAAASVDPCVREIIVVDDRSSDRTAAVLAWLSIENPRVRPLGTERNEGPARARALGVDRALASIILCIDDDVLLCPGAAAGHLAHHQRAACEVVVGHMPVAASGRPSAVISRYRKLYEERVRLWEARPDLILQSLWGGFVSFRREDYLAAGARCDPGLRYHEDHELGLVLAEMGRRACFDRRLKAEHRHGRTVGATLRDNRISGAAYAALVRRHPEVPAPEVRFAAEHASQVRSLTLRVIGSQALQAPLVLACELGEYLAAATGRPRPGNTLLSVGCRSQYYCGYRSARTRSNA